MKIAFVSQPWNDLKPPVNSGSIAILTYQLAQQLSKQCDIVIYSKAHGLKPQIEVCEGVEYRRVSVTFDKWLLKLFSLFSGHKPDFSSSLYHLAYVFQIAIDLRRQKCDVVQIFNFSQFVPIIRLFNPKIKISLRMSCEWLTQLNRDFVKRQLASVNSIVGCSNYISGTISDAFPEFSERCHTIHNGRYIDAQPTQKRDIDRKQKKLLFVGRVSPEKGVHVLLESFKKVVKVYSDIELEIIGPTREASYELIAQFSEDVNLKQFYSNGKGTYLSQLLEQLPENISHQVHFRGPVPYSQLGPYYQDASVFVFPSVWDEPSGNPLIESMALGLPVVSTLSGGTPEYIEDGQTGLLVEPGDVNALSEAILQLVENDSLRQSMGEAAKQRAANLFSAEKMAATFLSLYRDMYDERERSPKAIYKESKI